MTVFLGRDDVVELEDTGLTQGLICLSTETGLSRSMLPKSRALWALLGVLVICSLGDV